MMMFENCSIPAMLLMGGTHFIGLLAVIGLFVFLGVMTFRHFADRTSAAR